MKRIAREPVFDRVIRDSKKPVFVDFCAPECPSCEVMEPKVQRLEKKCADRVRFVSLNIGKALPVADRYHVMSVPQFTVFVDGKSGKRFPGEWPRGARSHSSGPLPENTPSSRGTTLSSLPS